MPRIASAPRAVSRLAGSTSVVAAAVSCDGERSYHDAVCRVLFERNVEHVLAHFVVVPADEHPRAYEVHLIPEHLSACVRVSSHCSWCVGMYVCVNACAKYERMSRVAANEFGVTKAVTDKEKHA